jgi:hypothetical protein
MSDPVFAEDLTAGMHFPSGAYTVSAKEIAEFARQWNPLPMHTDPEAAEAGFFGALIASGVHTFAIWQRLAVLNIFQGWQIIDVSDSRTVVTKMAHLRDQNGLLSFEMRAEVFMRRRPAPQPAVDARSTK